MTYRPNPDDQGWVTCRNRLLESIAKWQKRNRAVDVEIHCPASPRYTSSFADPADRAVAVTFAVPGHPQRTVTVNRFARPVDNLWALAVGLDAIRLNEMRGLDDVARQVYAQLAAPKTRDPWEIFGLRPGASVATIEGMYRLLARERHPDAGGSDAAMAELNAAREELLRRAHDGR